MFAILFVFIDPEQEGSAVLRCDAGPQVRVADELGPDDALHRRDDHEPQRRQGAGAPARRRPGPGAPGWCGATL